MIITYILVSSLAAIVMVHLVAPNPPTISQQPDRQCVSGQLEFPAGRVISMDLRCKKCLWAVPADSVDDRGGCWHTSVRVKERERRESDREEGEQTARG